MMLCFEWCVHDCYVSFHGVISCISFYVWHWKHGREWGKWIGENGVYVLYFYLCVSLNATVFCLILIYFKIHLLMILKFSVWSCNTYILSLVCFVSTSFSKQCPKEKHEIQDAITNPFWSIHFSRLHPWLDITKIHIRYQW